MTWKSITHQVVTAVGRSTIGFPSSHQSTSASGGPRSGIELRNTKDPAASQRSPVRNGNRWLVAAVDPTTNRLAAERLEDRARVPFEDDYLREHVTHGYAVTVSRL